MEGKIKYQFSATLWKSKGQGAWYFVTLPQHYSTEIRSQLQWQEEGWGRMKAYVHLGDLSWNTSIWFDSKSQSYVLPIKSDIRKKLTLKENDLLKITLLL